MFSGIRSLIFGAYEEDSGLSNVQTNIKAAQLLPSLEDQQKEEEERLLRESQFDANDGQIDSLRKLQDSANFAEDAWELIDFDEEEKKTVSGEKSQERKQEKHLELSTIVTKTGGNFEAKANLEKEKNVVDSELAVVAQQVDNNETLIVTDKGKKTKGRGQLQDHKEVGRLSSPTTTTTTNTTTTTTVTKPTPSEFSADNKVSKSPDLRQVVKSNGIPVYVRPTISFAAVAAKNSSPIVACGTPLKLSSCVAIPMTKSNELSSTIITKGKTSAGAGLKRQRPMSTSSWSSQSDFNDPIIVDSDDESIASSDFSDCDYDHGYNHDQLMKESKPKQSNKHRRDYAVSKSLSVGEKLSSSDDSSKNGLHEHVIQKQISIKSNGKSCGKNTRFAKSKKKKSTLDTVEEPTSIKMKNNDNNKSKIIQVSKAQQCMGPPPPPPPPTTNNSSGNDSSDAAEMDESWFVTPPSCFDGCKSPKKVLRKNTQKQGELIRTSHIGDSNLNYEKSFRSDLSTIGSRKNLSPESTDLNHRSGSSTELENLLIEHPSMYIQRASKQNQQQPMSNQKLTEVEASQMSNPVDLLCEKNVCRSNDAKSADMTKTMQKVVTSAKGKGNKSVPKDISNPSTGMFSHENATRQEAAIDDQSSIRTSVTLLSARPLSSSSSSPSPFSSDNEDNIEDMDLYKTTTTDLNMQPCNHDAALTASTTTSCQKKDCKLVRDEESKENSNIAIRAAVRVLPAAQLMDDHLPYWQKKKKRPQRRSQVGGQKMVSKSCSPCSGKNSSCSSASEYSDCSVPSLISSSSAGIINRIGSSIVANITNLTTSLPNVQNVRGIAEEMRKFAENVDNGSQRFPNEHSLIVQRKLAKSHMTKQNKRLASDTGNRRVGRKTKMFARANGYSIDRKVQKNFH